MKLTTAVLFAKDLDRMAQFYEVGLGLMITARHSGWVAFAAGGVTLALHALPEHLAAEVEVSKPPVARDDAAMKIIFACEGDLVTARAHLQAHGAVMLEPHGDGCEGLDPEGNVFRIARASK